MSNVSDLTSTLSPEKRKLLSLMIQQEATRRKVENPQVAPIPRVSRELPLPLSFMQQRLWFFDQLHPNSPLYNITTAVRLTGRLDVAAFHRALSEIVRRHEILRTTFGPVGEQVSQIIMPAEPIDLPVTDLSGLPAEERETQARQLAEEEAQTPFNLATGPLIRARLARLGPMEHLAVFIMHHIVSDGWSVAVLIREVIVLYNAFSRGQPSPLPELQVQYVDYAAWQHRWLRDEVLEEQLSYWKRQLANLSPILELPTDYPRPVVQTHRGRRYSSPLPKGLSEALTEFSRREDVTLYMVLLAAFQALLHRYSGQDDIVVGIDIANRTRLQLEPLIGFFVNNLVMRADFADDPSFRELLGRVKETALAAHSHCDIPFEMLVEALRPERRLSQTPLFQVLFTLQNYNELAEELRLGELSGQRLDVDNGTAKFDISLIMSETQHGLVATWHYSTDLFKAETIARMNGYFQQLLADVIADPRRQISALALLTPAEREMILVRWNDTRREYPSEHCVHALFEGQAARGPDRIAVLGGEWRLSYGELNGRANQLAHYLREQGAGPGTLIGVCMERAPEMIVGVLAALKSGAAYVPMDPSYPPQRLAWMLEDCRIHLLLTQDHLSAELPVHVTNLFCVDADWEGQVAWRSRENPAAVQTAADPAYAIFTSGSTGRPKGILLRHQGLCNLIDASNEMFDVNERSRVLQFSSFGFDVSVWEIFMSLTAGATLCLNLCNSGFSIVDLREHLLTQEISVALLPPSVLRLLPSEGLPTLRTLVAVGEKCTAENVSRWADGRNFFNGYGPAEATVTVSAHLTGHSQDYLQGPPIGHPFPNTEFYILDRRLQPVPVGLDGELCIGGDQLALGYINNPDLTAEKFAPHPFSHDAGARLYRTGDMARYLSDGNVEYRGRADRQVKLRGYRIEPGEIESVLVKTGMVKEAVVTVREDASGDKRLVAYVVNAGDCDDGELQRRLRGQLRERVPDYMVPSAFVVLESMPLTPHGKVNRQALPRVDNYRPDTGTEFVAPSTEMEKLVSAVWRRALKSENISVHDNFFDLGGHSLLLVEVYDELRKTFKRGLTMLDLFRYTTISSLAGYLGEGKTEKTSAGQFQDRAEKQRAVRRRRKERSGGGGT